MDRVDNLLVETAPSAAAGPSDGVGGKAGPVQLPGQNRSDGGQQGIAPGLAGDVGDKGECALAVSY